MHARAEGNSVQPDESQLGIRLRHARLTRGLRLKDVASRVSCSESLVSKIERGHVSPSLKVLHRMVKALDISIASLLSMNDADNGVVKYDGERPTISVGGDRPDRAIQLERLVPYHEGNLLDGNIHIVAPGAESDGFISHEGEEVGFVLQGVLELCVEGKRYDLKVGDSFYFQSSLRHRYRNPGLETARILWINTPPTF